MKRYLVTLALVSLPIAGCVEVNTASDPVMRSGSAQAEAACVNAVNGNFGRPVASVISSEFSQANTVVMVSAEGQTFRCLTSETGNVSEITAEG